MSQIIRTGTRAALLPAMLAVLVACGSDSTGVEKDVPGPLAVITITPANVSLATRATQQFTAAGSDAQGVTVPLNAVWSIVADGGSITATGLFTAGTTAGIYTNTVKVQSGATSATATVTVTPGAPTTLTITPELITLASGATQQFTATAKDYYGNVVPVTPTWSVVAGGGSITATGLFTATTAGTFANTVQARVNGLTATANVVVTQGAVASIDLAPKTVTLAQGDHQQFTVTAKDAAGNTLTPTVTWSVVAGGGSIDGNGVFTAGAMAGTFTNTLKATVGSLTAYATIVVNSGTITTITFTGLPASGRVEVPAGGQYQFSVVGKDANGNVVPFTVVWSITPDGGGTIDASGLYTASHKAGTYTITATYSAAAMQRILAARAVAGASSGTLPVSTSSGVVTVVILPGPMSMISVAPLKATLEPGEQQQFIATGLDGWLNVVPMPGTPVWSLDNGGGTVGPLGLFTAGTVPGTYTVRVTVGGRSSTATVTVKSEGEADGLDPSDPASYSVIAGQWLRLGDGGETGTWTIDGGLVGLINPDENGISTRDAAQLGARFHNNDAAVNTAFNTAWDQANERFRRPCTTDWRTEHALTGFVLTPSKYCVSGWLYGAAGEDIILDAQGDPNAVFIFQGYGLLQQPAGPVPTHIVLRNGAKWQNVYWILEHYQSNSGVDAVGTVTSNWAAVIAGGVHITGHLYARSGLTIWQGGAVTLPAPQ